MDGPDPLASPADQERGAIMSEKTRIALLIALSISAVAMLIAALVGIGTGSHAALFVGLGTSGITVLAGILLLRWPQP